MDLTLSAGGSEVIFRGSSALLLNQAQLSVAYDAAYSSSSQHLPLLTDIV